MRKSPKKILICTKHLLYRGTLAKAINTFSDNFEIISTVGSFNDASYFLEFHKIDFLLIRLSRTEKKPFEFIRMLKRKHPTTKLIILTFWDFENYNRQLIAAGAEDYYLIDQKIEILIEKLNGVNKFEQRIITPKAIRFNLVAQAET